MTESHTETAQAGPLRLTALARSAGMLRVPAQPAYLALVGLVVRWFARKAGLDEDKGHELEVAVDEACTNVVRHAFPEGAAGEMTVVCEPVEEGLQATVVDRGRPFSPAEGLKIATEKRLRDPSSGGAGLMLIDRLADAIHYRWDEQEGNQLTLVKRK